MLFVLSVWVAVLVLELITSTPNSGVYYIFISLQIALFCLPCTLFNIMIILYLQQKQLTAKEGEVKDLKKEIQSLKTQVSVHG